MEAEWIVLDYAAVELETTGCKAVTAARVATVEYRHIVLLSHLVDCRKERKEVLLGVDVLLTVCAKEYVFALLQTKTLVHVRCLDFGKILVQHLCHRASGDVGTLLRQSAVGEVAACVLAVCHIHVADYIDDAAVGLLGQTLVLAAVAGFHVEDWNVQTLRTDDREARIGVAEHKHSVGLGLCEELVRAVDDVAAGCAKVIANGVHIHFGFSEFKVAEEDAVQVVVVVLAGVGENHVEVFAALVDDGGEADNLRARADNDNQLQLAIFLEMDI